MLDQKAQANLDPRDVMMAEVRKKAQTMKDKNKAKMFVDPLLAKQFQQQLKQEAETARLAQLDADDSKRDAESKTTALYNANIEKGLMKLKVGDLVSLLTDEEIQLHKPATSKNPIKAVMTKLIMDKIPKDKMKEANDYTKYEQYRQLVKPVVEQKGTGEFLHETNYKGLDNTQIDDIMAKHKWFKGVFPRDKIGEVSASQKPFAFIMNLDKAGRPGTHWVSVWIDPIGSKSIEYYDPLAKNPPADFAKHIKTVIDKLELPYYLKFKINMIKNQSSNTYTCGYHAIMFLLQRAKGSDWKFSTRFTDLKEDQVNKFKKQIGYGYI